MNPSRYSAEIETALYNAMLRQMVKRPSAGHDHGGHGGHGHGGHGRGPVEGLPPAPGDRAPLPRGTPEQQAAALASQVETDEKMAAMAALAAEARAPPSPPLCVGGGSICKMVASTQANTYFFGKFYPPTNSSAEASLKACEAACLTDDKCVRYLEHCVLYLNTALGRCVAMTFSIRPADPCELYSLVTRQLMPSPDTVVALKCTTAVPSTCHKYPFTYTFKRLD